MAGWRIRWGYQLWCYVRTDNRGWCMVRMYDSPDAADEEGKKWEQMKEQGFDVLDYEIVRVEVVGRM